MNEGLDLEIVLAYIKDECHCAGSPTTGSLAAVVWQVSNKLSDADRARRWMNACGYEAFKGWPLQRRKEKL